MKRILFFIALIVTATSCSHTYYVVRHAPKVLAQPPLPDPPLTSHGNAMAENLKNILLPKKIKHIFSTNTTRTKATAQPLSVAAGVSITTYDGAPNAAFIKQLKSLKKNTLVVGHSNTVDDVVNALCKTTKINGDLPETQYGDLFVVTVKGKKIFFKKLSY